MKAIRWWICSVLLCVLAACVSVGNERFALDGQQFAQSYPQIRGLVISEAASNGFGELTSEIKPSEFNQWKGKLFFQLRTANGTDQLFVEFESRGEQVAVWIHGAGTRSNPNSAAKAIQARLESFAKTQRASVPTAAPSMAPAAATVPQEARPAASTGSGPDKPLQPRPAAASELPKSKPATDARAKAAAPPKPASAPARAAAASEPAAKAAARKPAASSADK